MTVPVSLNWYVATHRGSSVRTLTLCVKIKRKQIRSQTQWCCVISAEKRMLMKVKFLFLWDYTGVKVSRLTTDSSRSAAPDGKLSRTIIPCLAKAVAQSNKVG